MEYIEKQYSHRKAAEMSLGGGGNEEMPLQQQRPALGGQTGLTSQRSSRSQHKFQPEVTEIDMHQQ